MRLGGDTILVASHNAGKVREIGDLLRPLGLTVVSAAEKHLPEPEETGLTFEANAVLKAQAAAEATGLPSLSDDSGLCVDALGGEPGIYSARWAGESRDFKRAMDKVASAMRAAGALVEGRPEADKASFVCALALAEPGGPCHTFVGTVTGRIVWPARGTLGFGYDPMFVPEGEGLTFGEMDPAAKHAMSHRAHAFKHFVEWLNGA
ncbi:MAG: RdgB/HAM1 family non-canonical purine NTP pyrophosphatase [Pseudomonadota bacterium]